MTNENVATVEWLFESFRRRTTEGLYEVYDPEVVWDARSLARLPDLQGLYRGVEGVQTWWRQWLEAWETIEVLDAPTHEAHGNQVISTWKQRNRGKGSGVELEMEAGLIFTFERGLIVRVSAFDSITATRAAAGLDVDS